MELQVHLSYSFDGMEGCILDRETWLMHRAVAQVTQ